MSSEPFFVRDHPSTLFRTDHPSCLHLHSKMPFFPLMTSLYPSTQDSLTGTNLYSWEYTPTKIQSTWQMCWTLSLQGLIMYMLFHSCTNIHFFNTCQDRWGLQHNHMPSSPHWEACGGPSVTQMFHRRRMDTHFCSRISCLAINCKITK